VEAVGQFLCLIRLGRRLLLERCGLRHQAVLPRFL
jgi:hypothetical protein